MPVAAQCPQCGKNLSETSVVAGAPHCSACGAWIVGVNGTLGLTSAYGVGDSALTRRRIEADLGVLREYQTRYTGMMEACKQQLGWGVERYAKFPSNPELLEVKQVPSFMGGIGRGLLIWITSPIWGFLVFLVLAMAGAAVIAILNLICMAFKIPLASEYLDSLLNQPSHYSPQTLGLILNIIGIAWFVLCLLMGTSKHFSVKRANSNRPAENARRQKAYEKAKAAALEDAVPLKAAQDHRLRVQIRELEGEIKAVNEKAANVRGILATL